jgi:hypothetical protein
MAAKSRWVVTDRAPLHSGDDVRHPTSRILRIDLDHISALTTAKVILPAGPPFFKKSRPGLGRLRAKMS